MSLVSQPRNHIATATAAPHPPSSSRQQHTAASESHSSHADAGSSSSQHSQPPPAGLGIGGSARQSRWSPFASYSDRIRLATPLPPDVHDAYRTSLRARKSGIGSSTTPNKPGSPLAFGDFTGATLDALHTDSNNFPPSQSAENLAILRACLGTNLLSRALKIFQDMRKEATNRLTRENPDGFIKPPQSTIERRKRCAAYSKLDLPTYNALLAAICRRAVAEESPFEAQRWVDQAWVIYREMESGNKINSSGLPPRLPGPLQNYTTDPIPDATTIWTFSRGLIKTMQRHPSMGFEQSGLGELVSSGWRLGVNFESVISSSLVTFSADESATEALAQETDSQRVVSLLKSAAGHSGNEMARVAIEQAEARVQAQAAETGASDASRERLEIPDPAADIPELLPIKSLSSSEHEVSPTPGDDRPLNLWLLQQDLAIVSKGRSSLRDNEERQRWLEESALESARRRLEADALAMEAAGVSLEGKLSHDATLQKWMFDWVKKLEVVLTKEVARIKTESETMLMEGKRSYPVEQTLEQNIAPFLQLITPGKMALITVLELMRMQGSSRSAQDMKTTRALITIGHALEQEHYADILRKNPQIVNNAHYASQIVRSKGTTNVLQRREAKRWLEQQDAPLPYEPWTQSIRARMGSFLVGHFLECAKITRRAVDRDGEVWEEEHPAVYATYNYVQGKKLGVIKVNDAVAERLDKGSVGSTLHPRFLPMLVKPRLWLGHDSGGYLTHKNSMMRFKDSAEQSLYLRKASENQSLETVGAGLDVLGETPWIINEEVFKVMTEIWNSGEDIADMPPLVDDSYGEIPRPDNYETDLKARSEYLRASKQAQMERTAIYSLRCDTNYKLEIARAYLGERFYFPHNVDFRGRAYPIPPHLNHIGNDLCRGLLLFADTKPLGKPGLRWLRIHLANVFGYDKASFDERETFAKDHYPDIEDSVKNPLKGKRWWLQADDPWQCLATCHELYNALNHPEGPENFPSRLPVHQDGTCNGLQHYAALGGDLDGAKQVNLASGERPSDVYTAVADLVIADIEAESRKPNGDYRAALLKGKITRKVVKQTVMTTVYGVTFIGAKNQVLKQLTARGDIPSEELWGVASFLAKRILKSVGDLFSGAEKIQTWLVESAKLIAKSIPPERVEHALNSDGDEVVPASPGSGSKRKGTDKMDNAKVRASRLAREQMTSVIWTSPLGLPVVQPYRKNKKRQISTAMQTVFLSDPLQTSEVAPGKQASAFPPNFIHSLDATHMILTALECRDAGLTFASVHDSYWTHACDVETMSELIRDTFVRLHLQPILPTLRQEFLERYQGYKVPVVAAKDLQERRNRRAAIREDRAPANSAGHRIQIGKDTLVREDAKKEEAEETEEGLEALAEQDESAGDSVQASSSALEGDASGEQSKSKSKSKEAKKIASEREWVEAKFIDLADVLPPLPEKGGFDVNEIKRSQYFFS
ncbi:DNA/RNA polymerase [Microstroma glucosiphilum]|uniref:DNA-directed RNA polymerase n=1 Tax=Pseudomicrostroma glucosiphilum TaxID=1684307 RepID=A0A316TYU7_9BASI|nr:DNA/RNA polymerase [Pseudomicrostroma glucosiphilum]PWN18317.1 DNA/RNA polymerase [Pseudomicrostroma glucosiphilum]